MEELLNCGALESEAASAEGVKVPFVRCPLACAVVYVNMRPIDLAKKSFTWSIVRRSTKSSSQGLDKLVSCLIDGRIVGQRHFTLFDRVFIEFQSK